MEGSSSNSISQIGRKKFATSSVPRGPGTKARSKREVYNEVVCRLKETFSHADFNIPGFEADLWAHFKRLPTRYVMYVNVDRPEDVIMHKNLLDLAHDPANRPLIEVRGVQCNLCQVYNAHEGYFGSHSYRNLAPISFSSFQNIGTVALNNEEGGCGHPHHAHSTLAQLTHEITVASADKPKLLGQLTTLLSNIGLNIREAHVFSTSDGYSLAIFAVDGWPYEESEQLKNLLEKEAFKIEKQTERDNQLISPTDSYEHERNISDFKKVAIPCDGTDVWEIDPNQLNFENKVASGAYGDLYKGTYCTQNVAIKCLKPECVNSDLQREFAQEVYIMRKVRHKNVVQFLGACTKPPNLYIITEFMSGGSVYDYLHKHNRALNFSSVVKVAIHVSKGMNYLHKNNIIHRDLKSANLLMDENGVVKVADFGVARVKAQTGVMTAETGTYRWMAPEVIEHKPYDHKADVFSFGIVLWELLTRELPYESLTPLQAAIGVVQKDLRPVIPDNVNPKLVKLLESCWRKDPQLRPDFADILLTLQSLAPKI